MVTMTFVKPNITEEERIKRAQEINDVLTLIEKRRREKAQQQVNDKKR